MNCILPLALLELAEAETLHYRIPTSSIKFRGAKTTTKNGQGSDMQDPSVSGKLGHWRKGNLAETDSISLNVPVYPRH